jgi:repressor LexA
MEPLGIKIRKQRRRLGLTLDELSGRTGISKPYLSLIETGRVPNPPSDEKLKKLEQTLGFTHQELLTQAHLQRTPQDVRAMLAQLLQNGKAENETDNPSAGNSPIDSDSQDSDLSGMLKDMVTRTGRDVEALSASAVPVINRPSADYPRDFKDLSYPPRVADQFIGCPDVADKDAFAARVHGDSMSPKYRQGDVVVFSPALTPRSGDDCFIRFGDGQTTFKRAFFETDAHGRRPVLRLQPRNEQYAPTLVPSEQVSGLYRAVYRYQRVDDD